MEFPTLLSLLLYVGHFPLKVPPPPVKLFSQKVDLEGTASDSRFQA